MKFQISREWLERRLAQGDDADIGAGGTPLEQFKKDMEQRTVTPAVLTDVPTELDKDVRFVREQRGCRVLPPRERHHEVAPAAP